MIRVRLQDEDITRCLGALGAALDDMTPAMGDIGEYLVVSTKDRFAQGTAPDGTSWAPKSPTTIAVYQRRGDRVDFRPLFGPSGRLSSEILYQAHPTSVTVGSNLVYAATMQLGAAKGAFGQTSRGGPIPWGDIPARPFLGLSTADRSTILEIVAEWLESAASS